MAALLVAGALSPANVALHDTCRDLGVQARLLPPGLAARRAHSGEIVLGRVGVRPTLDGVEAGLDDLSRLEEAGFLVLNRAEPLLAMHDRLRTRKALADARIPQPRSVHVREAGHDLELEPPYVVKPRFGGRSADVVRCDSRRALRRTLRSLESRPWFAQQGVLVQQPIPSTGKGLRVLVSGGTVVGATGTVVAGARTLALRAAGAVGGDLVGVDLLPTRDGHAVNELDGCAEFTRDYSLGDRDVFEETIASLLFPGIALLGDYERVAAPAVPQLPEVELGRSCEDRARAGKEDVQLPVVPPRGGEALLREVRSERLDELGR